MSEEEQSPLAPAAALLFQAPQFQEPAPPEPRAERDKQPRGDDEETDQNRKGRRRNQKGGKPAQQGAPKKDSNAADESAGEKRPDGNGGESKGKKASPKKQTRSDDKSGSKDGSAAEVSQGDKGRKGDGDSTEPEESSKRRRRRRPRGGANENSGDESKDPADQVQALKGSTRLEAKRMRRREGRKEGRRRQSITESEFLARREAVDREMVVRHFDGLDQIAVLEDGLLVEHYVARHTQQSIVGNVYLGRVQNVLPSMEAAFVDIGKGRNAVLYAGEVNWDSLGMEGKPRRIEQALKSGDTVLVQVTKDPIGHKGARLTSQITLAGRYLVFVPGSSMLGISRRLPDNERSRLKKILREAVPENAGVIVRTAAEGATAKQLQGDIDRLAKQWAEIQRKQAGTRKAPQLLRGEPELVVRVVRDIFNEDFKKLVVEGNSTWETVHDYVTELSPELEPRLEKWTAKEDVFKAKRIDQQLAKGMDRKVWLPSGGTLVIDRTEALTVVDVNTGKFIGSGGTLEETVTRNNLEAAEEIVRQLRLRDIGGIIIIDFVDMVLESNRDLVLRRLVECLGRDRTRHQVTEITSLGLVQMTRKRVGEGLVEAFSTTCEHCEGRGFVVHDHPVEIEISPDKGGRRRKGKDGGKENRKGPAGKEQARAPEESADRPVSHVGDEKVKTALSAIAAATVKSADDEEQVVEDTKAPREEKSRRQVASKPADKGPAEPVEKTAEAPSTPRRRRAVTSELVEPAVRDEREPEESVTKPAGGESRVGPVQVAEGTAGNGEEPSLVQSATAALDAAVKPAGEGAEAKPRRRRKVVSQPASASQAERVVDEEKKEAAQQAVQELLGS